MIKEPDRKHASQTKIIASVAAAITIGFLLVTAIINYIEYKVIVEQLKDPFDFKAPDITLGDQLVDAMDTRPAQETFNQQQIEERRNSETGKRLYRECKGWSEFIRQYPKHEFAIEQKEKACESYMIFVRTRKKMQL